MTYLELITQIFQTRLQDARLCVNVRNPEHEYSSNVRTNYLKA